MESSMAITEKREYIIQTLKNCFAGMQFEDFELYSFGSWAYGEPNRLSDIDILVNAKRDFTKEERIAVVKVIRNILDAKGVNFDTNIDLVILHKDKHIKYVLDRWHLMEKLN
jgi:predicted nucleotidyltransferase